MKTYTIILAALLMMGCASTRTETVPVVTADEPEIKLTLPVGRHATQPTAGVGSGPGLGGTAVAGAPRTTHAGPTVISWFDPDGNLYSTTSGQSSLLNVEAKLPIQGTAAAQKPGRWRVESVTIGRQPETSYFIVLPTAPEMPEVAD